MTTSGVDVPMAPLSKKARRKERIVQRQSSTMKEMEEWAYEGREVGRDYARSSGKLADNVTEERMLHNKLWDLSKERYKFLSQSDYEKRTFVDRQLRKSAVFRELLKDFDLRKKMQPQEIEEQTKRTSSMLDRLSVSRERSDVKSKTDSGLGGKSKAVRPQTVPANVLSKTKSQSVLFETEVFPKTTDPELAKVGIVTQQASDWAVRRVGSTKSTPAMRKVTFGAMGVRKAVKQWKGLPQKSSKSPVPRPTTDDRYRSLESCLCENWDKRGKKAPNLPLLIQNNASLHKPPRRRDTRPKMTIQMQRFMEGLAF